MASLRCRQDIAIAALHLVIDNYNLASSGHDLHGPSEIPIRRQRLAAIRVAKAAQPTSSTAVSGQVRLPERFNLGDPSIKNEIPKKALGDRRQEWRFHCQIPHTETKPHLLSAPS
jgi:hypothetical protein